MGTVDLRDSYDVCTRSFGHITFLDASQPRSEPAMRSLSRHSRPPSPPSPVLAHPATTPVRPLVRRPSSSYTPTVTSGGQQSPRVNITRLAIEGRARQNQDGASVVVYLKVRFIPRDFYFVFDQV